MSENNKIERVTSYVSNKHMEFLVYYSQLYKLPITRLIAIAIDNECLKKENAFNVDLTLPESGENVEYAYAEQAGKILNYVRNLPFGTSLDMLYIVRHDIGISNKDVLLSAFKECLDKNMLEVYTPPRNMRTKRDDTTYYRLTGSDKSDKKAKSIRKKASQYETYQKYKKKFGDQ